MGYKTECERCGDVVDDPFLMGQFHEDEFFSNAIGDHLKEEGYELQDTITFCAECTYTILVDSAPR